MAQLIKRKVKGSTLVEVLVSMVIIVLIVSILAMILINLSGGSSPGIMLLANQYTQQIIEDTEDIKTLIDEETSIEGLRIVKKVDSYKGSANLALVSVTIYDVKDQVVLRRNVLIEIN